MIGKVYIVVRALFLAVIYTALRKGFKTSKELVQHYNS